MGLSCSLPNTGAKCWVYCPEASHEKKSTETNTSSGWEGAQEVVWSAQDGASFEEVPGGLSSLALSITMR